MRFALGLCLSLSALFSTAHAAGDKASFRIAHNALTYKSISTKITPDGGSATSSSSSRLNTYADGWEFYISKGKMNYYVYPGQQDNVLMSGYTFLDNLELGGHLGLKKSSRDKAVDAATPKSDAMSTTLGAYATYVLNLGEKHNLELTFMPAIISSSDKQTSLTNAETKSKASTTQINLSALLDHACTENLHMFASLGFVIESSKDSEAKTKTSTTTMALTPLGLRYSL